MPWKNRAVLLKPLIFLDCTTHVLNMCSFKSIHIFMCVCCIAFVIAEDMCGQQYELPNWELDWKKVPPPGSVGVGQPQDCPKALEVQVENQTENFDLTLLALPFINDKESCPPARSKYLNLRKFHTPSSVIMGGDERKSIFFSKIFTGCYYIEMTNVEGRKWIWNPFFENRSYHYYDSTLKCNNFQVKPREQDLSAQLIYNISIPLTCSRLRCQLLEHQTNHTKDVLDSRTIPPIQECLITYNGNGMVPLMECKWNDTRPQLSASVAIDGGHGWQTTFRWKHLKKDITFYGVKWEQDIRNCNINYHTKASNSCEEINDGIISYADLMTWEPVIKFGSFIHVVLNVTNEPSTITRASGNFQTSTFMIIIYILLGITITATFLYWRPKYARILSLGRNHAVNRLIVTPSDIAHDQEESNHIMLIHAYDLPVVMEAIEALRRRLQQISQIQVHALYSNDELSVINALGAMGWVESLLKNDCKVVWVDTPQLRFTLKNSKSNNGQQEQHKVGDFRDEAIPYAVDLCKSLFQNATTQYRRLFVVRLKGLDVEDGNNDPLQVFSPHTRYCIPDHLSRLCENLAVPIV